MRVRRALLQSGIFNAWLGSILLIAPLVTIPARRTLLAIILDLSYGSGFLGSALLCGLAWLLWTERMERRGKVVLLQRLRIAALTAGFSMCLAFFAIALLSAILSGWTLSAIEFLGLAGVVLIVEGASLSDGDLTPTRERHIWGHETGERTLWTPRWRLLLWWRSLL